MKAQVNLNLSALSVPQLLEAGKHYSNRVAANPTIFPSAVPTPAAINAALTALGIASDNAAGGGKQLTAIMNDKRIIVENLLTRLAHYVEGVADGSETVILLAGMTPKRKGGRRRIGFTARTGKLPLSIELRTIYVRGACYIFQMYKDSSPITNIVFDPNRTWTQVGVSTKSNFTVTDLAIGDLCWFRYAVVDKNGQGPWSDPISKIVEK